MNPREKLVSSANPGTDVDEICLSIVREQVLTKIYYFKKYYHFKIMCSNHFLQKSTASSEEEGLSKTKGCLHFQ
jgi:hypothetical protein